MTPQFFSPILVIYGIRLKFQSTAHLECFKYPYWYLLFLAQIWLFWLQRGQFWYLKCQFFFHGSSLLWKWGLSSEAQVIWPFQTCLNWYHIAQIGEKSFFGLGGGQISSKWKISKNKSHLFYGLNLWLNGFWPNRKFANYHPPLVCLECCSFFIYWMKWQLIWNCLCTSNNVVFLFF